MKKFVLLFQAGIANILEVDQFNLDDDGISRDHGTRNARYVQQGSFDHCCSWADALKFAGCDVRVYSCNMAGRLDQANWSFGTDACPFEINIPQRYRPN